MELPVLAAIFALDPDGHLPRGVARVMVVVSMVLATTGVVASEQISNSRSSTTETGSDNTALKELAFDRRRNEPRSWGVGARSKEPNQRDAGCGPACRWWTPGLRRILIVDDHELVRTGLRGVLSAAEGFDVVAEASDGIQALAAVELHHPDVVVMDLQMPGMGGIEATRRILKLRPDTRVLVVTMFDDDVRRR